MLAIKHKCGFREVTVSCFQKLQTRKPSVVLECQREGAPASYWDKSVVVVSQLFHLFALVTEVRHRKHSFYSAIADKYVNSQCGGNFACC